MSVRTSRLADTLVEGISDGIPLRQLCRDNGISNSEVYRWFADDAELAGRIAHARVLGFDQIAEHALEIADDQDEEPASRKVRIETRLKLLAKWDPRRYGDKIDVTSGGDKLPSSTINVSGLSEATLREIAAQEVGKDA